MSSCYNFSATNAHAPLSSVYVETEDNDEDNDSLSFLIYNLWNLATNT